MIGTRPRRALSRLAALAVVAGLAACTPANRPMTAMRLVDGAPVALLAGCADFQIDSVTVSGTDGQWTVDRTSTTVPDSMPLLAQAPPGWKVTDGRLTALTPGSAYVLYATTDVGRTVPIHFIPETLAGLGADQVIVGNSPGSFEKVTEKEYRKRAEAAC